jgi:primosomal protein N' (replication factor Y) (superfamily II helicase)
VSTDPQLFSIALRMPAHANLGELLTYQSEQPLSPGQLVRVPLGKGEALGVVWGAAAVDTPAVQNIQLKSVAGVLDGIRPLHAEWRDLVAFAARYYQRSLGEVALATIPVALQDLEPVQLARRLKAAHKRRGQTQAASVNASRPEPSEQQRAALAAIAESKRPVLLHGQTGSGKTEVYLRTIEALLAADPQAQALVMVPEINLTPQLHERLSARLGEAAVTSMHSGLTPPQRLQAWLDVHDGRSRVLLGTRMAIFASFDRLRLIVVDEEHDASYKSQDGARHSARDLAVLRAHKISASGVPCQVILGSATPSLETWAAAGAGAAQDSDKPTRYQHVPMPARIGAGKLPTLHRVDMAKQPKDTVLAQALKEALAQTMARGEQALILLNRRGYAPVLHCPDCGWKSECPHCSAYRVFHKRDRTLKCHHCSFTQRVPSACPSCGSLDLQQVGRGTERLEEDLNLVLADIKRPNGAPLRIERADADTTKTKGALAEMMARVHAGDVDVLVGTQMLAKGHDFRRITLVAALGVDSALYSSDFRASERLFALLMQVAGRAGRDAALSDNSSVWIQTHWPDHPLFKALAAHDYAAYAAQLLQERTMAGLPPNGHQALLRAESKDQLAAQAFLQRCQDAAASLHAGDVMLYSPVPMPMQKIANIERAQMLVECAQRAALQQFLPQWLAAIKDIAKEHSRGPGRILRWAIDVDPTAI